MKIWRVEDIEGLGCYRHEAGEVADYFIEKHDKDIKGNHPTPELDIGIKRKMKSKEICGFKTLRQAKKWFTREDLTILKHFEFKLKKIKVSKITAIGKRQVLAIR